MSKILSITAANGHDYASSKKVIRFSVTFDDGIIVVYSYDEANQTLSQFTTVSVGPDSYFLKNYKLPGKANMAKRLLVAEERIKKNRNRYKVFKS